jgi:3',5'-cyclic AMP phosphodiesterase CpdA
MIRLAHFSDIHVEARAHWTARDWLGKRLTAWLNLRLLGRGRRFRDCDRVLAALRSELRDRHFDRVVFSGDATALGFEEESARAAALLGLGDDAPPGLAVPGNHDYLTVRAAATGHFECHFAPWLTGERVDGALYPFAQRVGPAWLVAVNAAVAHWGPIDASGRVGPDQLRRLATLLGRLDAGPRVLVTHYPVRRANGRREKPWHGLRDLDAVLAVAGAGGVALWLHGHNHRPYHHAAADGVPFPVICAGSATERARWSYGDYTLDGERLRALVRVYDEKAERFVDGETFAVTLGRTQTSRDR